MLTACLPEVAAAALSQGNAGSLVSMPLKAASMPVIHVAKIQIICQQHVLLYLCGLGAILLPVHRPTVAGVIEKRIQVDNSLMCINFSSIAIVINTP